MAPGRGVVPRQSPKKLQKPLVTGGNRSYLPLAQFRTCLWSRAGWWASGQEAGQPPESNLALDTPNRQPEAKPAHPALKRGTRLKATTNGLFWSRWPSKGQHRRGLFLIAGRAVRGHPFQSKAASSGEEPIGVIRVSIARRRDDSHPLTPGGLPPELSIQG